MYVSKKDRKINPIAAQQLDRLEFRGNAKLIRKKVNQEGFTLTFLCRDGQKFVISWNQKEAMEMALKGLDERT